ncbi:HAUS augmin-like complex subunit 7 [Trichosurus vulpecula]|uniref:HAUS augmin-like complex subunit 7 n=1 Tax=Trichosurus vulpecula TaxID=9337 RepID=UPI00186B1366|nr:HAUS augmin-like complex subunit 7 [Trichosurus vulpecula]
MVESWSYSWGSSNDRVAAWQINWKKKEKKEEEEEKTAGEEWGDEVEELEKDEEEEDPCLTLEVLDVFKRLMDIKCPFLEGLYITEPKTIKQLLCSPSIYRLTILEWLFGRLYPPSEEFFATFQDPQAEEKILELVRIGHELMLCGPNDQNLIEGYGNVKRQLCFFKQLLDLVRSLAPGYANFSSVENFNNLVKKNEKLLHKLFSSHLQEILDPKLSPLPLDIECHLKTKENLKSRESKMEELSKKLNELTEMLEELKEFPALQGKMPSKGSSNVGQTVRLTLSDFHQLITAFIHVYETEWRKHSKSPAPNINQCGPLFQSVCKTLILYSQELKAVGEVIHTSKKVEEIVEQQQLDKVCLGRDEYMMTLASKMEELRQKHKLFKNSLQKPNVSNSGN